MSGNKPSAGGTANIPPSPSPAAGVNAQPSSTSPPPREAQKREPPPMQRSMHMQQSKVPPEVIGTPSVE